MESKHLFQSCCIVSVAKLASMPYIGEAGDTAWRQTDLLMGFLRLWLFSEKPSVEVYNRMILLHSWNSSLL